MIATGIGSMPGEDVAEAQKAVLGSFPDLPHLVELPARGATATMIGRTIGLLPLDADLQPAGWRLTGSSGSPGIDHRRARSLLAQDLDTLEELAQGYVGAFKVQLTGPLTLVATVERPRGDKLLADHGARREVAEALAEAVTVHVRDVRRRLDGVDRLIVQVDEPALPAVLSAAVPTASGFGKHRRVDLPEASGALALVLSAITDAGAEPWVHSCAPGVPWDVIRRAGAVGLSVDLDQTSARDYDDLAEALESGTLVALGVVPTSAPSQPLADTSVVERVRRWLDMLGLDPQESPLAITPTCGLAGAGAWSRQALTLARTSAAALTD